MPLPRPTGQGKKKFIGSCMGSKVMKAEYPENKQRYAVCMSQYKAGDGRRTYRTVVHAISSVIGDDMPESIQYLPPGKHNIHATKNGKPAELEVAVHEKTADLLQKSFDKITASGLEQVFIDFNHEDAEASAWLKGFYWGGDDPVDGGVRAKVEWTSSGKDSLLGKNFRKFSPTFTVNSRGEIDGTTLNAGGLVNRPAFKEITPVIAVEYREGETPIVDMITNIRSQEIEEEEKEKEILSEEEILEEEKKLEVSSEEIVEEEEEEKIESIEELKEKVKTLEAQLNELTDEKKDRDKTSAKELVKQAVAQGRIPAQNREVRAKWVKMILTDPSAKELLFATPVNAAFDRYIDASGPSASGGGMDRAETQMRAVSAYQSKNKTSFEQAWTAVSLEKPELFNN